MQSCNFCLEVNELHTTSASKINKRLWELTSKFIKTPSFLRRKSLTPEFIQTGTVRRVNFFQNVYSALNFFKILSKIMICSNVVGDIKVQNYSIKWTFIVLKIADPFSRWVVFWFLLVYFMLKVRLIFVWRLVPSSFVLVFTFFCFTLFVNWTISRRFVRFYFVNSGVLFCSVETNCKRIH